MEFLFTLSLLFSSVLCIEVLYDGRAKPNFDTGVLDKSSGPYLTYAVFPPTRRPLNGFIHSAVKGSEAASHVIFPNLGHLRPDVLTTESIPVYPIHPRQTFPNAALERPIQ